MRPLFAKMFPVFLSDYLTRYATFRSGGSHRFPDNSNSNSNAASRRRSTAYKRKSRDLEMQLREFDMTDRQRNHSEKTIEMIAIDNASSTAELTVRAKDHEGSSDDDISPV